jgi:putative restriction endonuclease
VLDAIHLAEKAAKGVDHPENGLVLCATHHRAFDRGLFAIEPATLRIVTRDGVRDLRLT